MCLSPLTVLVQYVTVYLFSLQGLLTLNYSIINFLLVNLILMIIIYYIDCSDIV